MSHQTPSRPLTPSSEPSPAQTDPPHPQPIVDFSPATVPYNESFENELMGLILHPPTSPQLPASLDPPMIPASSLPIPLSSPLRTHPSPIPGLLLTHENGYHTGGPGPSSETIRAFAEKVGRDWGVDVRDTEGVRRVIEEKVREATERMGEREKAVRRNREVDEELEKLRLQRDAEVRVLEKMKGRR